MNYKIKETIIEQESKIDEIAANLIKDGMTPYLSYGKACEIVRKSPKEQK